MRLIRWLAALLLAIAAAVALGAIPVPVGSRIVADGQDLVRIYVFSNGFHSDIVLPDRDGETLSRLGLTAADFPVDARSVRYWAVGWGSRTAYTSLRRVVDLTPGIVARALAFDTSVMHVQPFGEITGGEGAYAFDMAPADYDRLIAGIRRSFTDDTQPIVGITQGFGDRFYHARGRFSAVRGCNVWTGRRLREAGVGVGLWTVFAQSLEFGLARTAAVHSEIR
jgi:uncharacterized protein (TIGR02117 family)